VTRVPTFREAQGAIGRWRRRLRRRVLEPILLGRRSFRETVLNALAGRGHLVYCRTGDAVFLVDPSDRVVGSELMWRGEWQRGEIVRAVDLLAAAGKLSPSAVFVDAGANIGTHTVYAMKTGRFARAVAFEPEPHNAELLRMNIKVNDLAARVMVVEQAVGAQAGSAVLHLHPRNKGHHTIGTPPSVDGLDRMEVPVVRLDAALAAAGVSADDIGLVWVDVEGYEPEAVAGLGSLIERAVPLAMEYAPQRYNAAARDELIARLARHYTVLHRLSGPDGASEPVSALAGIHDFTDVLLF
jgi:FkbM family methyltransferase